MPQTNGIAHRFYFIGLTDLLRMRPFGLGSDIPLNTIELVIVQIDQLDRERNKECELRLNINTSVFISL